MSHSVQSASRAWRDGADIDWVVSALVHDIGDHHAPCNHDAYAGLVLKPFVREQCSWVVGLHATFLAEYWKKNPSRPSAREAYRDVPYYDDCVAFCELWDQSSFDPDYDDLPLEFFEPMLLEVFGRSPYDPRVLLTGTRVPLVDPGVAAIRAKAGQRHSRRSTT